VKKYRIHPAWFVAVVSFVAWSARQASAPPVRADRPLHDEFGWSLGTISAAVSVNCSLRPHRRSPPP